MLYAELDMSPKLLGVDGIVMELVEIVRLARFVLLLTYMEVGVIV